jgi:molecular chaperone GrpE (heat shock protein)
MLLTGGRRHEERNNGMEELNMESSDPMADSQEQKIENTSTNQKSVEYEDIFGSMQEELTERQLRITKLEMELTAIHEKLHQLTALFQGKIQDDTTKEILFERLHSQLAAYREDFLFKHVLQRIFIDLIRLFDTLEDTLNESIIGNLQREDCISRFQSFHAKILRTLRRQDVELIEQGDSTRFDEATQEAVDTRPVRSPGEDQQVLEVVRKGFTYHAKVIRPEQVVVGRYEDNRGAEDTRDLVTRNASDKERGEK